MEFYGPTDAWPHHPRPEPRQVLSDMRADGFTLRVFEGHTWGRVTCPGHADNRACELVIYSTSGGGTETAAILRRLLVKCRRRRESDVPASRSDSQAIESARVLVEAAILLLVDDALRYRADERIANAEAADDDEVSLVAAYQLEALAKQAEERAWILVDRFDLGTHWRLRRGASELAGAARSWLVGVSTDISAESDLMATLGNLEQCAEQRVEEILRNI